LQLGAVVAHVIARDANVAVVGLAYFHTIFLNDVRTAALDDGIGRDDFKLVLVTLSELCH